MTRDLPVNHGLYMNGAFVECLIGVRSMPPNKTCRQKLPSSFRQAVNVMVNLVRAAFGIFGAGLIGQVGPDFADSRRKRTGLLRARHRGLLLERSLIRVKDLFKKPDTASRFVPIPLL